jgi:hypothetical protein
MKKFLLVLSIGMALVIVACASGDSESLCDAEEGPCIGVRFDGENCTVEGPTVLALGEYTVVFANDSEDPGPARVEILRLNSGWTLEDLVEDTADRPTGGAPSWVQPMLLWSTIVAAGETHNYQPVLGELGDYGVLCFQVPQYAIYGDGFTLDE